jgi:hypothetical protein
MSDVDCEELEQSLAAMPPVVRERVKLMLNGVEIQTEYDIRRWRSRPNTCSGWRTAFGTRTRTLLPIRHTVRTNNPAAASLAASHCRHESIRHSSIARGG